MNVNGTRSRIAYDMLFCHVSLVRGEENEEENSMKNYELLFREHENGIS